ncbi:hypothetical protein H4217_004243, partial [Coemansia sp. RSA 1939]
SENIQSKYESEENRLIAEEHNGILENNSKVKNEPENSPFEVVRTAVSNTDDSSMPSMSFRTHILGIFFVCLISFVNQFYWERDNPIALNLLIVQLLCYPMGVGLAWILPKRTWNFFGYKWTMNPGPFTIKEHVLVSLMSNASAFMALTVDVFAVLRLYYNPSFVWYFVPGYLLQVLSTVSILCLVAPNNHLANMLGDGKQGLGLLAFSLDWSVFSNAFLNSPIATPFWAACNLFVGFVLVFWVALPIAYFNNLWGSASLPLYSANVYTLNNTAYNITRVMRDGVFNEKAYNEYSPLRMALEFSWVYGIGFAALMSILVHIIIYNGKEIISRVRETKAKHDDIHGKLMMQYPPVRTWWYLVMLVSSCAVGIGVGIGAQIGVPWWGYMLSFAIAIVLVVPVGIIQAISNRQPALSIVAELLSGIVLQGIPTGYSILKLYGHGSLAQALSYAQDMKLAHYMKIPPRQVLVYQIIGIVISVVVQTCLFFWLIDNIPDMCQPNGYPWVCRSTNLVYSASVIWNLIGPLKVFGEGSPYSPLLWGFLFGLVLPIPVYLLQRRFPKVTWLKHVYIPVILSGIVGLPPMPPIDFPMWFLFGFVFNFIIHRYWNPWWQKYNFTLSAGLDSGLALSGIFQFMVLAQNGIKLDWWGNQIDRQCPLSSKPWIS